MSCFSRRRRPLRHPRAGVRPCAAAARRLRAFPSPLLYRFTLDRAMASDCFTWRRVAVPGAHAVGAGPSRSTSVGAVPAPPTPLYSSPVAVFLCPICGLSMATLGFVWCVVVRAGGAVPSVRVALSSPRRSLYAQPALVGRRGHFFFFYLNGKNADSEPPFLPRPPRWSTPARALPRRLLSEPAYLPPPCSSRRAQSVPVCGPRCATMRGVRGAINEPRGPCTR